MSALSAIALSEQRRARAAALVNERGLPHRRIEEWKYSDLRAALGEAGVGAVVAEYLVKSLPYGMDVWDLARPNPPAWVTRNFAHESGNTMNAASLALSDGGIALRVPRGLAPAEPLKLDFTGPGHLRALLVVEEGASLNLVEGVTAADFRNVGFEIVLGEGASLEHMRICPALDNAVLVEEAAVRVAAGAIYRGHFTGFGARLSRMELEIALEGAGAQAHLSGVALLDGARHSDITTHVTHAAGNTVSTQLFKHVAAGKGHAIYQGRVTVAKGADGSDSRQTAKALLLGETAEADLKPELEIFADDVKCAHGAAVGDLDAESLFYLRARGIPEAHARRMLLQAFLEDAVAQIADMDNRELARTELLTALEAVT
ncbi:MAG: Fe-S cluster assembly protein SufD [Alphaproteobacteria bacterium 64-11]|nr:Fe-S cluster assembly protein SufD [Alphaproteobacteria bacterium]OJU11636.1 MAG: Fe-S cluster assembly protein SufD [Alphaproteobacteria bacterium 64-11]